MSVNPIPEGYHSITPYLIVSGAAGLIDFMTRAFDAKEIFRTATPDGTVMHAEIRIGNSMIMISESREELAKLPADHVTVYDRALDQLVAKYGKPRGYLRRGQVIGRQVIARRNAVRLQQWA